MPRVRHSQSLERRLWAGTIANALEVTTDFLFSGTLRDKSADIISDEKLLSRFRKIEQLPPNKKKLVKEFLDAFIFKSDQQKQLAS